MTLKTFKPGGIHLHDKKHFAQHLPIEIMPEPSTVTIPLVQHIGIPAKALVAKGDHVLMGQVIGEAQGNFSVPVHASVSGEVEEIKPFPHPSGVMTEAIRIRSDGKSEWHPDMGKEGKKASLYSKEDTLNIIKNAGIVGMGGATFPSHIKLSPPEDRPCDVLIINGAECEPYLTCDHRLMLEKTDTLLEGIFILSNLLNIEKIFIGIEANKKDAIALLEKKVQSLEKKNKPLIIPLKEKYPQGAEKSLIQAITKRVVPVAKLPFDVGVIVHNIATVIATAEAVQLGKPLVERVLTVTGDLIQQPKNLLVRIGTSIGEVIEYCGGCKTDPQKVILGGPMMGLTARSLDTPVAKGVSGILLLSETSIPTESSCIRCGKCIEHCPAGLMPVRIHELSLRSEYEKAKNYHPLSCIECGVCSYQCPAKIHLLLHIRDIKAEINKRSKK